MENSDYFVLFIFFGLSLMTLFHYIKLELRKISVAILEVQRELSVELSSEVTEELAYIKEHVINNGEELSKVGLNANESCQYAKENFVILNELKDSPSILINDDEAE